jgi:hypothetical protein
MASKFLCQPVADPKEITPSGNRQSCEIAGFVTNDNNLFTFIYLILLIFIGLR